MNQFWQSCVLHLEQEFPPQQISAWIRPLIPLAFDEAQACLRLSAPNRFKLDWVRKNFAHQIEAYASTWYKRPIQVLFELPTPEPEIRDQNTNTTSNANPYIQATTNQQGAPNYTPPSGFNQPAQNNPHTYTGQASAQTGLANGASVSVTTPADERSRLNVELTFDNFVTGKANQLARAAALQVAENPGTSYNP